MITLITNDQHVTHDQSLTKACLTRDQHNWQVIHTWLTRLTCDLHVTETTTWPTCDWYVIDTWSCNQHVWHVTVTRAWLTRDQMTHYWYDTWLTWLARHIVTREWHNWHIIHTWPTWHLSDRLSTSDHHMIKYDTWLTHWHDQHVTGDSHDWQSTHDRVWHVSEARPVLHWHMIDSWLAHDHHEIGTCPTWLTHDWHIITPSRDWHRRDQRDAIAWLTCHQHNWHVIETWLKHDQQFGEVTRLTPVACDQHMSEMWPMLNQWLTCDQHVWHVTDKTDTWLTWQDWHVTNMFDMTVTIYTIEMHPTHD